MQLIHILSILIYFSAEQLKNMGVISKQNLKPSTANVSIKFDTSKTEFPYLVSIRKKLTNRHICAGTIITDKHVVTAANCTVMDSYRHIPVFANPYELRIYRKPLQEKKKEVEFWNVKSIYRHPDYINDDIDLAILRIYGTFDNNFPKLKNVSLIEFFKGEVLPGAKCFLVGWDKTNKNKSTTKNELQNARITILNQATCKKKHSSQKWNLTENLICATAQQKQVCKADIGSPVICNKKLFGIVSFMPMEWNCKNPYTSGVYLKLNGYRNWIKEMIVQLSKPCNSVCMVIRLIIGFIHLRKPVITKWIETKLETYFYSVTSNIVTYLNKLENITSDHEKLESINIFSYVFNSTVNLFKGEQKIEN